MKKFIRIALIATGVVVVGGWIGLVTLNNILAAAMHGPQLSYIPPVYFPEPKNALPKVGEKCPVANYVELNFRADARKIELLATELTTKLSEVESDPELLKKAREMLSIFQRASNSNRTMSSATPEACGTRNYSSLLPLVQQLEHDQGMGLFSDFPAMVVYAHGYDLPVPDTVVFRGPNGTSISYNYHFGESSVSIWTGKYWVYINQDKFWFSQHKYER